jgi:hypothetical protein
LIDLISNIRVGDAESRSKDVLGRIYEYFLSQFASAEGKKGGEFYTPRSVVKLLVEMIEPFSQRPPSRSQGGFHSCQPTVQHFRLGRRPSARRQTLAVWQAARR